MNYRFEHKDNNEYLIKRNKNCRVIINNYKEKKKLGENIPVILCSAENERFVFWSVYDLGGSTDKSYDYDRSITKFLLYP